MNRSQPLTLGVAGAAGRMGQAVIRSARDRPGLTIGAAFDRPDLAGSSVDGCLLQTVQAALDACDVIVDFSAAAASAALAEAAAAAGRPALVIGSTGLSAEQDARIARASAGIAIVKSGNFSVGVNILLGLVERASASLNAIDYDLEIFEAHHRRKVDAPSGTALMLGRAAARGRQVDLADVEVRDRQGARPPGAIGFSVMRGGGIVGEHSVTFAADDEIVTLSHSARDRDLFARGAVVAAAWVCGRPPGLYDMQDVLGLRD